MERISSKPTLFLAVILLLCGCYHHRSEYYYYNKANLYLNKGDLEAALEVYQEVLERNPYHAGAHNNLGVVYMRKNLYSEAIVELARALELDPNYKEACNNLAVAYKEMKAFAKAQEMARRALAIDPNYLQAYRTTAQIYFAREDYDKAEEYFRQVIKRGADTPVIHIQLGLIYQRSKKMRDAIAQFRRAVDMSQRDITAEEMLLVYYYFPFYGIAPHKEKRLAVAYGFLAAAYLEDGQEEKAADNFVKCLDYDRDDVKSRYALAGLYRDRGEDQQALEHYGRVTELDEGLAHSIPEYRDLEAKSHRELALLYERLERDGEALHHWGEHDRLVGGSAEAQHHKNKLRSKVYE